MAKKVGRKCGGDRNRVRCMEVGETIDFPIERWYVAKQYAADLGIILHRKYRTHADRVAGIVTVTRVL